MTVVLEERSYLRASVDDILLLPGIDSACIGSVNDTEQAVGISGYQNQTNEPLVIIPDAGKERSSNGNTVLYTDQASANAGKIVHAVVLRMLRSGENVKSWIVGHYDGPRGLHRTWANKVFQSLGSLRAELPQPDDTTDVRYLGESRLYIPFSAVVAAQGLADYLKAARLRSPELGKKVEHALRASRYVLDSIPVACDLSEQVHEFPEDSTVSPDGVDMLSHGDVFELAYAARTLSAELGGDIQTQKSARTDLIIIENDRHSPWEAFVAQSFEDILNKGFALDPDRLDSEMYYCPIDRLTYSAAEIIVKFAEHLQDPTAKTRMRLYEIKTFTRYGDAYNGTENIWEEFFEDPAAVLNPENPNLNKPGYAPLKKIIAKHITDTAKKNASLRNMFRIAHIATGTSLEDLDSLMQCVDYGIMYVHLDIRSKVGKKGPGVPEEVGYRIVPLSYDQIKDRWNKWLRSKRERAGQIGEIALNGEVTLVSTISATEVS